MKANGAANAGSPVWITEILMSLSRRGSIIAALFPKEQVPASTPIPPPRGRDHLSLAQSWLFRGLNCTCRYDCRKLLQLGDANATGVRSWQCFYRTSAIEITL
jgi:hypothetical protein